MATQPVTTSGGTMPSFDTQRAPADAKLTRVERVGRAMEQPVARSEAEPPIDRVEVSTAARELARVITDPQPRLQLSQQQLKRMSTGREGNS